jgi:type IV secretory pathway VirJ component
VTLPESAYLFVDPADVDDVTDKASAQDTITVDTVDPDDGPAQVTQAVADLAGTDQPFGDLPAVDLPSSDKPAALAILVSGDGGWRDLDKTIGEWLSARGVHVVGLDSLHYFWSKRTPKELATDIASIVERADPDKKLPVMLIGYSFGADTVPFAYPLLPQDLQQRTKLLALMAPGLTTSFQVTIEGWLDIDDSGYQIVPAIAALPADRVICVYGEDDGDDSACPDPSLKAVTRVKTSGGHHFDGDYEALGQQFLDRLKVK